MCIDGRDVKTVTLESLRRAIGIVQQDVYLFSGTVYENILYGRPDATRAEVEQAAKLAGAHEFISALHSGYDTYVGERGVKLSGGQKQRISIARVFLKNPPILILDEATSALDNESEHLVGQSLARLAQGRTTLTIAHRLTTIQHADRILVLGENGIEAPRLIESLSEGQQVILVDHNEALQSADGLDAAEIVEIVDHHRLGGLVTAQPLRFNAKPVGSTAAIVAREFEIEGVELPRGIAALLLGAMLTDTVIMKSPTTTDFDRDIIARTAAAVGVDPVEYGMSIFKCRSNPAELPVDKLVNADAKEFELSNGNKVYIGQYETVDLQAVLGREAEIREAIKGLVADKGYQFVLFFATDILAEGSQFICEGDTDFVNRAFDIDCTGKSVWMPGVLSRKKQVAAPILAL